MTYFLVVYAVTMLVAEAGVTWFQRLVGWCTDVR